MKNLSNFNEFLSEKMKNLETTDKFDQDLSKADKEIKDEEKKSKKDEQNEDELTDEQKKHLISVKESKKENGEDEDGIEDDDNIENKNDKDIKNKKTDENKIDEKKHPLSDILVDNTNELEDEDENQNDDEKNDDLNEGFIAKLNKVFNKKEYVKTLKYVQDKIKDNEDHCTKSGVEEILNGMVFNKVTKKVLDEDKKFFKSIVDEIYKDCKKEEEKNESIFGTDEWNKKYSIKKEDEIVEEPSLNEMVNETLNKKEDKIMSFNEIVNESRNISNPNILETKKK